MGDFWRCVKANGLWTTLKMIDSKEFRAELYEAAQESYIQWAYILDRERSDHSEEFVRAIEDIHEYEDDPMYKEECDQNWKDHKQRNETFIARIEAENKRDPAKRVQKVFDMIARNYGLPQNENTDTSLVAQGHSASDVSDRYRTLWSESVAELGKKRGSLVLLHTITYDWRIEEHQTQCRIIAQLQGEGLIDWDSLFPNGGNHATVRRDVEAFDRFLYSKWERSLVLKDTDKEGRKREYRKFLRDRERNWGRQYLEWLGQGKDENKVKVDM